MNSTHEYFHYYCLKSYVIIYRKCNQVIPDLHLILKLLVVLLWTADFTRKKSSRKSESSQKPANVSIVVDPSITFHQIRINDSKVIASQTDRQITCGKVIVLKVKPRFVWAIIFETSPTMVGYCIGTPAGSTLNLFLFIYCLYKIFCHFQDFSSLSSTYITMGLLPSTRWFSTSCKHLTQPI